MGIGIVVIYGAIAIVAGIIAGNKNRSKVGWFFLTLLLPLLVFVILALPKKVDTGTEMN